MMVLMINCFVGTVSNDRIFETIVAAAAAAVCTSTIILGVSSELRSGTDATGGGAGG